MRRQNQETCCIADILGPRAAWKLERVWGNCMGFGTATHRIATTYRGT